MPIFIIPLVGTFISGMIILLFIGEPIGIVMKNLEVWLSGMQNSSKIVLGIILGSMIAFDMGGPLNKTAFFFAVAMIPSNPTLMAAVATAVCTPPLGLALATFIGKKKFTVAEQESGKAALIMGCIGITEGAIPFAASDPIKVLPSIIIGGAAASVTSLLLGATNLAAWGGLIVLPVVGNRIGYIIAVIVGTVVTALVVIALKKTQIEEVTEKVDVKNNDLELDITF